MHPCVMLRRLASTSALGAEQQQIQSATRRKRCTRSCDERCSFLIRNKCSRTDKDEATLHRALNRVRR